MEHKVFKLDITQLSPGEIINLYTAINEAFAEYEEFVGKPYLRFESQEKLIECLSDKDNHFLVMKQLDRFVAGVCFRTEETGSDTLYFGTLWVAPSERSKGLAGVLIQQVEEEAKRRNKKGLLIRLFKIPKLIQYYQALGFNFVEENPKGPMVKYF
ncbi:GNAT family N-acetyltransferase [uncultured Vibrio sp.]|uniref:GNAT family N-acetyltransferase n=1 Tax=uncultured Vibrio sp. TaxID=114054 RepID=UPI0025E69468|nr:GNAT family N-acetyltransferase [uncultured Vibrio sp.]